ncbi:MAG: hypothetical protein ACXABY_28370 [Candidatus Thorarchaeota archaeon]|jgi:hypothetical protein
MAVKKLAAVLLVIVFLLTGCAMFQAKTSQGRYDEALASWNSIVKEYRLQYAMQTPETKAKWDNLFVVPLYEAGIALGAWGNALDDFTKEQAFSLLKNQAIKLLFQYQIIEIKE